MKDEKFTLSLVFPEYLIRFIDQSKAKSRSEYISSILNKNLPVIEEILKLKQIKDTSLSLPYKQILELEELATKYDTTAGRIILMALLMEFYGGLKWEECKKEKEVA